MDCEDQFTAVMTAKYDEGKAALRELIRRSGEDEIAEYLGPIISQMNSADASTALLHTAAAVGMIGAWLSLRLEGSGEDILENS